jgi:hypothetical protein
MKRFYWKAWLRPFGLVRGEENCFVAEVSVVGRTLRNADIARLIVDNGSELQYETLLNVIDLTDRLRLEAVMEGRCVQTGFCRLSPRIGGNWVGASMAFHRDLHRVSLDMVPTAEVRAALEGVDVEVLGVRDSDAFIGLVTDVSSGLTDGTLTPGGQIVVSGNRIKIVPEGDASLGVFLSDGVREYALPALAVNRPKVIIALLPVVPAGVYSLSVVTRYSRSHLLNEPRRITYGTSITVL